VNDFLARPHLHPVSYHCYRKAVEADELAREGHLEGLHDGGLGGAQERRRIGNHWIYSRATRCFRR